jgi:hypothetical protein
MTGQQLAGGLLGSTTLSGTTITANAPVVDFAQTWNNAAVTFTGAKLNITDTASNAASLLMDLQVGSSTKFSVNKLGYIRAIASSQVFLLQDDVATFSLSSTGFGGTPRASIKAEGFQVSNSNHYAFTNATSSNGTVDLFLTRRGAANLRLGFADAAAPVAQTLSVQSVVAGTTNTAGTNFTITGSQGTGTGAGGSLIFQVAPAGSSGTAQNALATALTINSAGLVSVTPSSSSASSIHTLRGSLSTPAYSFSTDTNSGAFFGALNGLNSYQISVGGFTQWAVGQSNGGTTQSGPVAWAAVSGNSLGTPDVLLYRDAANKLALRNGTAAQTFNVYNTFTDASNYERGRIAWLSNVLTIGTEKLGTGVARALEFQTDGTTRLTINTSGNATFAGAVTIGQSSGFSHSGRVIFSSPAVGVYTLQNNTSNDWDRLQFGGTTSSFPALKRSTTFLQARLADDSAFAGFSAANVQAATAYTVATLPTPATGMIARVTDATAPVIGATVTGGGAVYALVNYNGANWTVIGV